MNMARWGLPMLLAAGIAACASGRHGHTDGDHGIVPSHEKHHAQTMTLKGPTKTHGISAAVRLAALDLAREFEGLKGHQLRVRELTIAPGGVVAVHRHQRRPGVAYILEGEMVEYRTGAARPIIHRTGGVAIEYTGVSHWWKNQTDKPARALVIDIVPVAPK